MTSRLTLFHVKGFRSSRVLWLLKELEVAYKGDATRAAATTMTDVAPTLLSKASTASEGLGAELRVLQFDDPSRFREEKPHALLRSNPNGKVPALLYEDELNVEEVCLFESGAICTFVLDVLDREHRLRGCLLVPSLPKNRKTEVLVF